MSAFPTALFLAAGDAMNATGGTPDYVPTSGDYLNLLDPATYLALQGTLIMPPIFTQAPSAAGAAPRMRSTRNLPNRTIRMQLKIQGGGTDATSVWALWRALEHKLEQARVASGPFGHSAGDIVLAVRYATSVTTSLEKGFTLWDVVDGRVTPLDLGVNPSGAYGAVLELDVLPYGRMPGFGTVWPGALTYTANIVNTTPSLLYVGPSAPTIAAASGAVGSLAGPAGAMARVHVLDTSTAGAINRIRVGRRAVLGPSGGMVEADWAGVVNCTAIGSATLQTTQPNSIGSDFARLAATDTAWHDVARASSGASEANFANGIYDVWARVRESIHTAAQITTLSARTTTLSAGGAVLPPDTYTIRLAGQSTTPTNATAILSPPVTITTAYPWTPNILSDGFEIGDASNFLVIQQPGDGLENFGDLTVAAAYALAGTFGMRSRGSWFYDNRQPYNALVQKPLSYLVRRTFTVPDANTLCMSAWIRVNGGVAPGSIEFSIMGLSSSVLKEANAPLTWSGAPPSQTSAYNAISPYGGLIAEVILVNGTIGIRGLSTVLGATNEVEAKVTLGSLAELLAGPIWIRLSVPSGNLSAAAHTATLYVATATAHYTTTLSIDFSVLWPNPAPVDIAEWGVKSVNEASSSGTADILYDDCMVWTTAAGTLETPNQGIALTWTNPNNANPTVYLQQANQASRSYAAAGVSPQNIDSNAVSAAIAVLPTVGVPTVAQFRARASTYPGSGAALNPIVGQAIATKLQDGAWHMINLGTIALPPASRIAAPDITPVGGTSAGDIGWQIDVQGASGTTAANNLDVDALWLFSHDEPQLVAEFPGLGNAALLEWILDTRKDGRAQALLRDGSSDALGLANVAGFLQLAAGNQSLLFLVEREGGVHDVATTRYQLKLVWTPLTEFFQDTGLGY